MLKKGLIMIAAIALVAPQVGAQGIALGPQVGFHKAADANNGDFMIGGALRLKLTPALGVEGSINYRHEEFADVMTVRSWPVMVTGMLYPLPVVYGALGAGWYNTTFDFDSEIHDDQTNQEFGWHFGGGVELPVGANVKLTSDIRYVFLDYDFEAVPFDDVDSNFYVITAGLLFGL